MSSAIDADMHCAHGVHPTHVRADVHVSFVALAADASAFLLGARLVAAPTFAVLARRIRYRAATVVQLLVAINVALVATAAPTCGVAKFEAACFK